MSTSITRRALLAGAAAATSASAQNSNRDAYFDAAVRINDDAVAQLIERQDTDPASRWRGAVPDAGGLHEPGSASGVLNRGTAAYLHPKSKYHKDAQLFERLKLAADHLNRVQTTDGNVELLITNFNSPPDTAFVMLNVAPAAWLARKHGETELFGMMEPFIRKAGHALATGGVHTPNHRWVVCAALALVNELFPDPKYVQRIDAWLAEGIDIDPDGQYSERSTTVYNGISDNALTITADRLKRPELLDPVRKNLDAMLYLLHPNGEVVTEISRRQDLNTQGTMRGYWYALRYLAHKDANGQYAALAEGIEPESTSLAHLMINPDLADSPKPAPPPDDYEKHFPATGIARLRRGKTSATLILGGNSRFFSVRRGDAVINAVRFASAFFGKAQFVPDSAEKRDGAYRFTQSLDAGYYQPFDTPRKVAWGVDNWYEVREERRRTEVCKLRYDAEVRETANGFTVRIQASGTDHVPLAVELNLREGGILTGCIPAPGVDDGYIVPEGHAVYRVRGDAIRFGPGLRMTDYTQVRGAQPKLPGPSVYLTAYTPFDHTLTFEWV